MRRDGEEGPWLFASLRAYSAAWLTSDLVAALTLAAIAIPEQLATARLLGVSPATGLLAFAAGAVAFAVLGANRFVSVGADSTIAPIMAAALGALATAGSPSYAALASVLALMTGIVLLVCGLARAGWIADLLSIPVTTGFLAGISVHILIGQLPEILGVRAAHGPLLQQLVATLAQAPAMNPYPAAVSLGVLAAVMLAERLDHRIPGALIGLVGSGLAVWALRLDQHGLAVIGALDVASTRPAWTFPDPADVRQLFPTAIIVAVICVMQTAAVVRSFPNDRDGAENVSQDFAAVGLGSILAAVLGAFAVNASPPRTAVVEGAGGRSQLAGLIAVAAAAAVALLAGPLFAFVPIAALSGVLLFVSLRIFRIATMREIYRRGGYEILLVIASAALVVLLPMQTGVTAAILLSLTHSLYIIARPACAVLTRVPGTTVWWKEPKGDAGETVPGVLVFAPGAPINFTNAGYLRGQLMHALATMGEPCRLVVIEANGVIDVDFTGAEMARRLVADLRARGIAVALARLESERAQDAAQRTGLIAALGREHVFRTVEDAIRAQPPQPPQPTAPASRGRAG